MRGAVVCGAGAAGLAAGAMLGRAGVDTLVIERSDRVAASWRSRYAALRLNTPGWMSTQPGYRATRRRYGEYPSRDKWIQYLEDYTAHHRLDVRFDTEIERIERIDGGWQVQTTGSVLEAQAVVVATGFDHDPYMPDWPGRESFSGELIHASAYSNPDPFRGKDVLVVGPGVTGSEVAHLLAEGGAARVRVACRTPPHIIRRKWLGVSVNVPGVVLHHLPLRVADEISWGVERTIRGNLSRYGLPRPPVASRRSRPRRNRRRPMTLALWPRSRQDALRSSPPSRGSMAAMCCSPMARAPNPTSSSLRPATGAGLSRSSATWTCWTSGGCRSCTADASTRPRRASSSPAFAPSFPASFA